MRFYILISLLTIMIASSAEALKVVAEPSVVMPGDAFLVRVSGADAMVRPEAFFEGKGLFFSSCGDNCFVAVAAADIRTAPGRKTLIVRTGERKKQLSITVKRHAYPVIKLSLPESKVKLGEEDLKRADREDKLLKELWTKRSEKMWQGNFAKPVANEISTLYGTKRIINGSKESIHQGIDLRGREGEAVRAANSGRVVVADEFFFGGNTIVIDHGAGVYTVYMHLSGFGKKAGDLASKGDVIGFVGSTGRSTGPHLHFGIKAFELSVNPVSFEKLKL